MTPNAVYIEHSLSPNGWAIYQGKPSEYPDVEVLAWRWTRWGARRTARRLARSLKDGTSIEVIAHGD